MLESGKKSGSMQLRQAYSLKIRPCLYLAFRVWIPSSVSDSYVVPQLLQVCGQFMSVLVVVELRVKVVLGLWVLSG